MSLKLAIGLGNSGSEYEGTRHNAGAEAVKRLAAACGSALAFNKYCRAYVAKVNIGGAQIILCVAEGYMNASGSALAAILKFCGAKISECMVLYDDITLEPGRLKLALTGSAGGHNGVADIIEKCGDDFMRVKLGIGPKLYKGQDLADHVLGRPSPEDASKIAALDAEIKEAFKLTLSRSFAEAQKELNKKTQAPAEGKETKTSERQGGNPESPFAV